jgi:hypothetical protein
MDLKVALSHTGAHTYTRQVLEMLKTNYNTHMALQSKPGFGPAPMATEEGALAAEEIKERVLQILEETGLSGQRAAKLDTDHFLRYFFLFI